MANASTPRPLKKSVRLEVSEDGTEEVRRETRNMQSSVAKLIQDIPIVTPRKNNNVDDILLSLARNDSVAVPTDQHGIPDQTVMVTSDAVFGYDPNTAVTKSPDPMDDGVQMFDPPNSASSPKVGKEAGFPYSPPSTKGRPRKHPFKMGKYRCNLCGITCTKPSVLEKHLRAHTNERPFPCHSCNLFFKTKSNLYKHLKSKMHQLRQKSDESNSSAFEENVFFESEENQSLEDSGNAADAELDPTSQNTSIQCNPPTINNVQSTTAITTSSSSSTTVNPYQQFASFESGFESSGSRMASIETVYSQRRSLSRQDSFDYGQYSSASSTVTSTTPSFLSAGSLISDVNTAGAQFSLKHATVLSQSQQQQPDINLSSNPIISPSSSYQQLPSQVSNKQVTLSNAQLSNLAEILRILNDACNNSSNATQQSEPQTNTTQLKQEPISSLPTIQQQQTHVHPAGPNSNNVISQLQAVAAAAANQPQPIVLQSQQPPSQPIISQQTAMPVTVPNNLSLLQALQQHQEQQQRSQQVAQILNQLLNINQPQPALINQQPTAMLQQMHQRQQQQQQQQLPQHPVKAEGMTVGMLTLRQGPGSVQVPVQIDSHLFNVLADGQGSGNPLTVQLGNLLASSGVVNQNQQQASVSGSRSSQEMLAAHSILEMASKQQQMTSTVNMVPSAIHSVLSPSMQLPIPINTNSNALSIPRILTTSSSTVAKKKAPKLQLVGKSSSFDVDLPQHDSNYLGRSGSVVTPVVTRQAFSMDTSDKPASVKDKLKNHILKRSFSLERSNSLIADLTKIEPKTPVIVDDAAAANIPFKKRKLGHSVDLPSSVSLLPQTKLVTSSLSLEGTSSAHSVASLRYSTKETYCLVSQPSVPGIKTEYAIDNKPSGSHSSCSSKILQLPNQNLLTQLPDGTCILQPVKVIASSSNAPLAAVIPVSSIESANLKPAPEVRIFKGGLLSNDNPDTYIRGRGRGRYKCEQCGIRCTKPSMLRKHIRSHTDIRPFICRFCNFSFKTKGNLTKHMKSKQHLMKCLSLGMQEEDVPKVIEEDTQIDKDALAKQMELVKLGKLDPKDLEKEDSNADGSDDDEDEDNEENSAKDLIHKYNKEVDDSVQQNLDQIKSIEKRRLEAGDKVRSPSHILLNLSRTSREMKNILSKAASISVSDVSSISAPVVNVQTMEQEKPVNLSSGKCPVPSSASSDPVNMMPAIVHSAIDSVTKRSASPVSEPPSGIDSLVNDVPAHASSSSIAPSTSSNTPTVVIATTSDAVKIEPVEYQNDKRCKQCGAIFEQPSQLSLHMKTHLFATDTASVEPEPQTGTDSNTTDNPRPFTCSVCNRGFRVVGHLGKHFRSKQHLRGLANAQKLSEQVLTLIESRRLPLQSIVDQDSGDVISDALDAFIKGETPDNIDLDADANSDVDVD